MGFYGPRFEMRASLSRHNSRNDRIDNLLYEELIERLRGIVNEPRYAGLDLDIVDDGIDWEVSP